MTTEAITPPVLSEALSGLSEARRDAVLEHLRGGTSADYLAGWFQRAGWPVGATTIKLYRRRLKESASE